jgi:hypothetical protein
LATDGNDVPRDVKALADRLALVVAGYGQGTAAARPAAGTPGLFYKVTSGTGAGRVDYDDGSTWITITPQFAGSGSAGTVAHSDPDHMHQGFRALFLDDTLDNDNAWHPGRIDTIQYDTLGMVTIGGSGYAETITVPAGKSGAWDVKIMIRVAAVSSGGYIQMELVGNGTTLHGFDSLAPVPITPLALKISETIELTAGDTLQVLRRASNDADITLAQTSPRPFISMEYRGRLS